MKKQISLPRRRPFKNVYQFKITLLETKPAVWRRIQVPESYTFYDLHVAIQDAMGWEDRHLHCFDLRSAGQVKPLVRIDCPFALDDLEEPDPLLSTEIPLKRYYAKTGDSFIYKYDFGDGWEHEVTLEGVFPRRPREKYPVCLGGDLSCPPEDCGGVSGYYDCIDVLINLDNSEGKLEWLGDWIPDAFDPAKVRFWSPLRRLKVSLRG